jgi:hypothetical protein
MDVNNKVNKTSQKYKLKACLLLYVLLLLFIIAIIIIFERKNNFFRWGVPGKGEEELIVISVVIDNYYKYTALLFIITLIRILKVIVKEIADPILTFSIYNPDKKVITGFTKFELQIYGNLYCLIDNLRYLFTLLITISQVDIALFGIFVSDLTTVFTIRYLLNEKKFTNSEELLDDCDY